MSLTPYDCIKEILVHARRFIGSESNLFDRPPAYFEVPFFHPVYAIERDLALAAFYIIRLHVEYQRVAGELSTPPFTFALRREINALPKIIKTRIQRWGWDYVLSCDSLNQIHERVEAHDKTKGHALRRGSIMAGRGKRRTAC